MGDWIYGEVPFSIGAFLIAIQSANANPVYTLEIEAKPIGMSPVKLYFADRDYVSFPADAIANQFFDGRAKNPLDLERNLPLVPERGSRLSIQIGTLTLYNQDGILDNIAQNYAVDGRSITVKLGIKDGRYDEFGVVFSGLTANWNDDESEVKIVVRDAAYQTDIPLQSVSYGGTGGADGTSNNAGAPKPLTFGFVRNITPILINPGNFTYQFHSRQAQGVTAVYDGGSALTATADYATYADLAAASVASGSYATCLALGLIRLGVAPTRSVTMDAQGDAVGGYVSRAGAIARRILTDFGGIPLASIGAGFVALDISDNNGIGWYSQSAGQTVNDAVNEVMGGVVAYWGNTRVGTFDAGRMAEPDAGNIIGDFDSIDILDIEQTELPSEIDPPIWNRVVGYQRNWTVQGNNDVAPAVSATQKQFLAEEYRYVTSSDSSIKADYLLAQSPSALPLLYDDQSAAQARADNLLALYKVRRQFLTVTFKRQPHLMDLGDTIRITWPRFGLAAGKAFLIVGIREECQSQRCSVTLWG